MKMQRAAATAVALSGGVLLAVAGIAVGAAAAGGIFAPAGVSGAAGQATTPMPSPTYERNAAGQTFGSAMEADSPEHEPDLIQVVATNGKTGYVFKADLDAADGTLASRTFKSPEEALRWQEGEGALDHVIPVYLQDGTTEIGEFLVVGRETQLKESPHD